MSAAAYIADLFTSLNVLFLSETWMCSAEETLPSGVLGSFGVGDVDIFQTFAMELPPGAGEGRRHGGTAMICRRDSRFSFSRLQCENDRLLAVQLVCGGAPRLTIVGCYMPYFTGTPDQLELYMDLCASLEALIDTHRFSAPLMLVGDFNCPLPRLPPATRPRQWAKLRGFTPFSQAFQRLLDERSLTVAEFRFSQSVNFTYERGGHTSHIDHIIVPGKLADEQLLSCSIIPPSYDNLSPNLPITCTLLLRINGEERERPAPRDHSSSHSTVLDWNNSDRNQRYCELLSTQLETVV